MSVRPGRTVAAGLDIEGALEQLAEQQCRDGDREHENGDADRCAIAETRVPEALEIDEIAKDIGAAERRALGHHCDEIERLERLEQGQHHHHGGHRTKLRQGDAQHHPKVARPLDLRRVDRLLRHIADPGEIENHRQACERPAAHDGEGVDRDAIVAEPLADEKAEAEPAQDAVEGPENRVEDEKEHQADGNQRHRHRKENRRAQQGREIDRANAHRVGDEKPENDGEGERHRQPLQIVLERDIEILVAEHVGVIGEPDEFLGRRHAVPFEEAQIDRVDDRIADEAGKQDDRQDQPEQRDEDMMAREGHERRSFVAHPRSHELPLAGKSGVRNGCPLLSAHQIRRTPCGEIVSSRLRPVSASGAKQSGRP